MPELYSRARPSVTVTINMLSNSFSGITGRISTTERLDDLRRSVVMARHQDRLPAMRRKDLPDQPLRVPGLHHIGGEAESIRAASPFAGSA